METGFNDLLLKVDPNLFMESRAINISNLRNIEGMGHWDGDGKKSDFLSGTCTSYNSYPKRKCSQG